MRRNIPHFIALLVSSIGLMDIVSALMPAALDRWRLIRDIFPIEIIHTSRTLTLVGGIYLFYLGIALWNQKKRAWTLAIITLIGTLFFHLSKGLDIEETILSSLVIILLWHFRSLYYVQSHRTSYLTAIIRSVIILLILFIYMVSGYTLMRTSFVGPENLRSYRSEYIYDTTGLGRDQILAENRFARWFESSISLFSIIAILAAITSLFAPAFDKSSPAKDDKNRLTELLRIECEESGYFALMDDKSLWFDDSRTSVVAYKKIGKFAIVLGEPIGESNIHGTAWQFQENMAKLGGETIWYNMKGKELGDKLGFVPIKIGEDAIISTSNFSLDGSRHKDIRNAYSHTAKLNLRYVWHNMASIPWSELKLVNDLYGDWTGDKKLSALTFSLGFYPFPVISEGLALLVKDDRGALLSALSFFPYHHGSGYSLDLMLRAKDAPSGVIESAVVAAIKHLESIGVSELNLGMAPLSNIEFMGSNKLVRNIRNVLMSQFNKFYGYKSLAAFKAKFDPTWMSKYIYMKSPTRLPSVLIAIAQAHRK